MNPCIHWSCATCTAAAPGSFRVRDAGHGPSACAHVRFCSLPYVDMGSTHPPACELVPGRRHIRRRFGSVHRTTLIRADTRSLCCQSCLTAAGTPPPFHPPGLGASACHLACGRLVAHRSRPVPAHDLWPPVHGLSPELELTCSHPMTSRSSVPLLNPYKPDGHQHCITNVPRAK